MYDNLWKWHADEHLNLQYSIRLMLHMHMETDAMVECPHTKKQWSVYKCILHSCDSWCYLLPLTSVMSVAWSETVPYVKGDCKKLYSLSTCHSLQGKIQHQKPARQSEHNQKHNQPPPPPPKKENKPPSYIQKVWSNRILTNKALIKSQTPYSLFFSGSIFVTLME